MRKQGAKKPAVLGLPAAASHELAASPALHPLLGASYPHSLDPRLGAVYANMGEAGTYMYSYYGLQPYSGSYATKADSKKQRAAEEQQRKAREKKERRKERNRLSAKRSRKRREAFVASLEQKNKELGTMYQDILVEVEKLKEEMKKEAESEERTKRTKR